MSEHLIPQLVALFGEVLEPLGQEPWPADGLGPQRLGLMSYSLFASSLSCLLVAGM